MKISIIIRQQVKVTHKDSCYHSHHEGPMTVANNNIDRSHYIVIRCIARQKKYPKSVEIFRILALNDDNSQKHH